MDLIEEIKKKLKIINKYRDLEGLDSVLIHIERAEYFLESGKKKNDMFCFTDTIYRTNHAFEGILKEAYNILTKKDASKKSIFQIEEFFNTNDIFNERVLNLFRNYRQQWRNPSTHNHNLFFSETEAFLAIISISSFIHVLLDQITEKLAFENEEEFIVDIAPDIIKNIKDYEDLTLFEKLQELLKYFNYEKINRKNKKNSTIELIGSLHAYFNHLDKDINVIREPIMKAFGRTGKPDFLLEFRDHKVILMAIPITTIPSLKSGIKQLSDYLKSIDLNEGILFTLHNMGNQNIDDLGLKKHVIDQKIALITPKKEN